MKKIFFFFLILIVISLFYIDDKKINPPTKTSSEIRALFVSYLELNTYVKGQSLTNAKINIKKIIKNTKKNNFNTIILQVRSYDDAIYKSKIFPVSKSVILNDQTSFDVLEYFIQEASKEKITIYIWINPFRITRPNEEITEDSYAYKYKDTTVVKKFNDTYYYNPARSETTNHILAGIEELIKNYQFKGILFDDYFYPNNDIDITEYEEYLKMNKITKEEYHLQVINNLVQSVYKKVKALNNKVEFGISPDGNIENNYNKNYADVKLWASKEGYVDFLMPQLYYGFNNTTKPYLDTINIWNNLVTAKDVKLYYALAFYKVGKSDNYAKEGITEWIENSDIIKRQIILARNTSNYNGFSLFRYDSLFNEEYYTENTLKELDNLESILKQ